MVPLMTILLMGIFQSDSKTEHQKYETLKSDGDFEVRFYPPAVLASVPMGGSYDDSRNGSFGALAGYIFGGNESEMQISMTAPVRISETRNRMSFVMPSHLRLESLPKPNNKNVVLHRAEARYVASVRFGGWSSDRKIAEMKEKLEQWLKTERLQHTGDFEYLGYNPPYQLANRRNEVIVPLADYRGDGK
jgi:hypothetical protein